jgi:hypothetical protein
VCLNGKIEGVIMIKQFRLVVFLAAAFMVSPQLMAEDEGQTTGTGGLLRYFDQELFQWNSNIFSGITLNFQNQSSTVLFGVNNTMKEAFARYPDVHKEYESYRKKTLSGNILMWGGFTAALGGAIMPVFSTEDNFERDLKIALCVMLGGLVIELTGAAIISSGQANIYHAVNRYNRNRIRDFEPQ